LKFRFLPGHFLRPLHPKVLLPSSDFVFGAVFFSDEGELLASFVKARLVKYIDGKITLFGGTVAARAVQRLDLHVPP